MSEPQEHRVRLMCVAGLCLLFAAAGFCRAVEVAEVRWGFDGRAVPGRINLLSVRLSNQSAEPFDDVVSFQRTDGLGKDLGAPQRETCYVAPFTSRWVQFYPYAFGPDDEWTLRLGRSKRESVSAPRLGPPAAVVLTDPGRGLGGRAALRGFPQDLFPVTVGATDGLHCLVVDYAPELDPLRRQALLDWLRRGGVLHVLGGPEGRYPRFSRELAVLNDPARRFRVGAGYVVRHPALGADVDERFLARAGCPLPNLPEGRGAPYQAQFAEEATQTLKSLVRPEHNWPLIYTALVAYLVLVFPVNYLVGRQVKGARRPVLVFLVVAVGFALLMGALGRRGAGERSVTHTLAYARALQPGQYDVTEWSNVFVSDGDYYLLTHPAECNIYSACQRFEGVNGFIDNGRAGRFVVDIPLYSSRPFLHRARMDGPDLGLQVLNWEGRTGANWLTVGVGDDFPERTHDMSLIYREAVYSVRRRGDRLAVSAGAGRDRRAYLEEGGVEQHFVATPRGGMWMGGEQQEADEAFHDLCRPLITWAFTHGGAWPDHVFPPHEQDVAHLLIYADLPEAFGLEGLEAGRQVGRVLYHVPLIKPERADE